MTDGFAFVAYPAQYRLSGVMTFIVSEDGVVYEKDLGTNTDVLAKAMTEYNPDSSWQKADEQQEEAAGKPQWQVGTITAVQPYEGSSSDPSATGYKVSVKWATSFMPWCIHRGPAQISGSMRPVGHSLF